MTKLKNYVVSVLVDATVVVRVKARNAKEAQELAEERAQVPSLCHQCSNHVEIGDIITAKPGENYASETDEEDFQEDEP